MSPTILVVALLAAMSLPAQAQSTASGSASTPGGTDIAFDCEGMRQSECTMLGMLAAMMTPHLRPGESREFDVRSSDGRTFRARAIRPFKTAARASGITIVTSQEADQMLWNQHLLGAKVFGPDGKKLGTLQDARLAGGTMREFVVEVGGFLSIGSKRVAVSRSDIRIDALSGDPRHVVLHTSRDKAWFDAAPEFVTPRR